MALTEFGKAVRMARIQTGDTLLTMANHFNVSPSYLSGMETGSKKISDTWVQKIGAYFAEKNAAVDELDKLAAVSNDSVSLEGLPYDQKMLVAGFAKSQFTAEELSKLANLLKKMNHIRE